MYSITEILLLQALCFFYFYYFPFLNGENINEFIKFYNFICENNPLILDYSDKEDSPLKLEDVKEEYKSYDEVKEKYEDKYLEKFKSFPNGFRFTESEFKEENEEYEKIKLDYEKTRFDIIHRIQEQLIKINEIQEKGITKEDYTAKINDFGIKMLIKLFDFEEEYNDYPDEFDVEELYSDLLKNKEELLKQMNETEKMIMTEEEMRKKARDVIINKKLDKFIDNYVLEYTPLGNIFMRYNNDKKSFEYFSNNSIPYRYLEPVGRKYVMTYWCKPIFIIIEEELKKAEEKYEEEKKKKEEEERKIMEESKNNPRKILAQLKHYNKESKDITMRPMKNRSNNNTVLPPQIKANLPDVNKPSEKQLLKENANRYTWEGRLTNFCPLKKIDRKILDKNLSMTYSDFKKMQQEQQNKK